MKPYLNRSHYSALCIQAQAISEYPSRKYVVRSASGSNLYPLMGSLLSYSQRLSSIDGRFREMKIGAVPHSMASETLSLIDGGGRRLILLISTNPLYLTIAAGSFHRKMEMS